MAIRALHLYESRGNLTYAPIWSAPLLAPFDEIPHTADLAFVIRAESLSQLHLHAQVALAFEYPPLLSFLCSRSSLDDIIIDLNALITEAHTTLDCPFKAVRFCDEIKHRRQHLEWEMIVDV